MMEGHGWSWTGGGESVGSSFAERAVGKRCVSNVSERLAFRKEEQTEPTDTPRARWLEARVAMPTERAAIPIRVGEAEKVRVWGEKRKEEMYTQDGEREGGAWAAAC